MSEETLVTQATTTTDGEQAASTQTNPEGEQAASSQSTQTEGKEGEASTTTTTEEKAPEGAPESYEFTPPEGQQFDSEVIKVYADVAKELNLTQESAQKILDKMGPAVAASQTARIEAVRNEWTEASKSDKEFGGDKLNENLGYAKQALDKFGSPELKEFINQSGLGNHPEMIRLLVKAGKALAPDTFVAGQSGGKPSPKSFNDFADKLYA